MLGSDLSSAPVAEKVGGTAEKTRSPYRWRGWMKSYYDIAAALSSDRSSDDFPDGGRNHV